MASLSSAQTDAGGRWLLIISYKDFTTMRMSIIIYMNDIPSVAAHSKVFLFADDTKCFKHIKIPSDTQLLQQDLMCLLNWSKVSHTYTKILEL